MTASTNVASSDRADQLPLLATQDVELLTGEGSSSTNRSARGTAEHPAVSASCVGTDAALTPHHCLQFSVYGTPIPQGSHKGFVVNGHAKVTEDNAKSRPWRAEITHAAIAARGDQPQMTGPIEVHVTFVMPRPKYHYRTGRHADVLRDNAPRFAPGKPDCDKLLRNLGDALTASAAIRDDAQIVVWQAAKVFADPGEKPGAHVFVMAATS